MKKKQEKIEEKQKICCRCKKSLDINKRNTKLKNICRKCYQDPRTKHIGQLGRLLDIDKKFVKEQETEQ